MSKNDLSSIVMKVLIVVFAIILIFILTVPPGLWQEQEIANSKERRHMSSISEAEKFYKKHVGMYTMDFDSIRLLISQDSLLQDRRNLAEATQSIYYRLQNLLDNDLLTTLNLISTSYEDMVGDFEDPEKIAVLNRPIPERESELKDLRVAADSLYHTLRALPMLSEYNNVIATAKAAEDLSRLAKNIADEKLSDALFKSNAYSDTLKILLREFNAQKALEYFQTYSAPLVKNFANMFFELELEKRSPFAERTISFQAQIEFALNQIISSDYQAMLEEYNQQATLVEGSYNANLLDYANLLDRYSSLNVSEEDSLLLEFNPVFVSSAIKPDKKIYVNYSEDFNTIEIESPVLYDYASENSATIYSGINSLKLVENYKKLFSTLDSLQPAIDFNLEQLRNKISYRNDRKKVSKITLELKTIPLVLKNSLKRPAIQYGQDLLTAVENLNNEGRFSKIQAGLQSGFMMLAYFASVVDSNKTDQVSTLIDDLYRDAAKVDTMFAEIKFQRSKLEWQSLREVLEPAKAIFVQIAQDLPGERDAFMEYSEQAIDKFEENEEGVTQYHYGIFPISVKNPGYIENGNESWKED